MQPFVAVCLLFFVHLAEEIAPTDKELRERYELRDCIQRDIQKIFPSESYFSSHLSDFSTRLSLTLFFIFSSLTEATLELFGSSANGFGSFDSDVDLCLILNEEYTVSKSKQS